jgi:hypothetical protein
LKCFLTNFLHFFYKICEKVIHKWILYQYLYASFLVFSQVCIHPKSWLKMFVKINHTIGLRPNQATYWPQKGHLTSINTTPKGMFVIRKNSPISSTFCRMFEILSCRRFIEESTFHLIEKVTINSVTCRVDNLVFGKIHIVCMIIVIWKLGILKKRRSLKIIRYDPSLKRTSFIFFLYFA